MADISIININGTDEYNIKDSSARTDINTINSTLIEAQSEDKGKVWKTDPVTGIPSWRTGEGGSGDYEDLSNLPTINNNTIIGDLTSAELGLQDELEAGDNITIEGNVISAVAGSSLPSGGLTGQVLTKYSNLDDATMWADVPVMQGASNYSDGVEGLAPKPYAGDVGKALFADGQYHTIYSAASGSTILVVTTDSALFGRTVYITDGNHTTSETMGQFGECYFTDISMFGNVLISCTDAEGNEAKASLNLTYFGTYQCNLTLNFATLRFTSSDLDLVGLEVAVWHNGIQIGTTSLRLMGGELVADFIVEELGDYTARIDSPKGLCRENVSVIALRQVYLVRLELYHIYAYQIDENNSDPATCVTEFNSPWGYENVNFTPAHMDFTNDVFEMGSWTGNEFFFPRPCLLGYDGTVIKYLDKNDYTKDVDGNTVDISSASVNGNVMIEFPTVYFARWQSANKTYVCISNKKVSDDFDAYAHHDTNGNVLPYIYIAAYDGSYDGTRLRSLSGKAAHNRSQLTSGYIMSNATRQQEVNFAKTNNIGIASGHEGHYTWHKADWDMVVDLLTLIGMSTDFQTTFGRGKDTGGSSATSTGFVTTGSMNTKGMFWGENAGAAGVKVFGIENFWANIWKACAGWVNANGTQKVKMTYGTEDGSTATNFNFDGSGYVAISGATPSGTNGGYISKWKKTASGFIPYQASGSQTTYMCDGLWFNNGQNNYAIVGGLSGNGLLCGAVYSYLSAAYSAASWNIGAALTCK